MFSKTTHIPQWVVDLRARCMVDVNDAALNFWRMTREQFLTNSVETFFHPDEMPRWEAFIKANRWGETGPWRCRRGDQTEFYCTVRWQLIESEGNDRAIVFAVRAGDSVANIADLKYSASRSDSN